MTRRQIWIAAAVIFGAAVGLTLSHRYPRVDVGPIGTGWVDRDAPRRIRQLAAPIERIANWPGLGHYLAGIAFIESRGNPRAGSDAQSNAARGWFGHRPKSARLDDLGLGVGALKDEAYAVALAAWYAHRCRAFAAPGQVMDWLAVRRCWAYPSHVDNVDHPGYRTQLARGLQKAGVQPDFMYLTAFPAGYRWPGIDAVLAAVGRPRLS